MEVLRSREELDDWLSHRSRRPRVLVPTMGALHRGHLSLIDRAKREAGDRGETVVSIFVNPTQFGPGEDFEAYPRPLDDDLARCRERGVTAAFAPDVSEIYSQDASVAVTENRLSRVLCGASRPGHFDGVCTIVAKLFHLVHPDVAVFGEKDYQQLAIVRRMVRDLDFRVGIVAGSTVRENDGLALSSRNAYLSNREREQAPVIHRAISRVAREVSEGRHADPAAARAVAVAEVESAPDARIDYLEIVDADTLERLETFGDRPVRIAAAVYFGSTRLIDNVGPPGFNEPSGDATPDGDAPTAHG